MNAIIVVIGSYTTFRHIVDSFVYLKDTRAKEFILPFNNTKFVHIDSVEQLMGMEILDIIELDSADPSLIELAFTRIRQKIERK